MSIGREEIGDFLIRLEQNRDSTRVDTVMLNASQNASHAVGSIDINDIPVYGESIEPMTREQIIHALRSASFRVDRFRCSKKIWDDSGYNDIGYRTQFGVAPAVNWLGASLRTFTYRDTPEVPRYVTDEIYSLEYFNQSGDPYSVLAKPREEFHSFMTKLGLLVIDEHAEKYRTEIEAAIRGFAPRTMVGKKSDWLEAYGNSSIESAEMALMIDMLGHDSPFVDGSFRRHKSFRFHGEGDEIDTEAREALLLGLCRQYAAYQILAKFTFGSERKYMPLSDLSSLSRVRRDRPNIFTDTTDSVVGSHNIAAKYELQYPVGVSNLFESIARLREIEGLLLIYRLLKVHPQLRIPKNILQGVAWQNLDKVMGDEISGAVDALDISDVIKLLKNQGPLVNLALALESADEWKLKHQG